MKKFFKNHRDEITASIFLFPCLIIIILICLLEYKILVFPDVIVNILFLLLFILEFILFVIIKPPISFDHDINKFSSALKYDFNYKNFNELVKKLEVNLKDQNYLTIKKYKLEDSEIVFFSRLENDDYASYWILMNTDKFLAKSWKDLNKTTDKFVKDTYNEDYLIKEGHFLICTKEYSYQLESMIKDTYNQNSLSVALIWNEKKIYIPTPKDLQLKKNDQSYDNLLNNFLMNVKINLISDIDDKNKKVSKKKRKK